MGWVQGFQPLEKSWKPGKWKKLFPDLEKSWNLKKKTKTSKNNGILQNQPGKFMKFCQWFETLWINFLRAMCAFQVSTIHTFLHFIVCTLMFSTFITVIHMWLISTWINVMLYISFLFHIYWVLVSWKNGNISGKIMEQSLNSIPEFGYKPCLYIWYLSTIVKQFSPCSLNKRQKTFSLGSHNAPPYSTSNINDAMHLWNSQYFNALFCIIFSMTGHDWRGTTYKKILHSRIYGTFQPGTEIKGVHQIPEKGVVHTRRETIYQGLSDLWGMGIFTHKSLFYGDLWIGPGYYKSPLIPIHIHGYIAG